VFVIVRIPLQWPVLPELLFVETGRYETEAGDEVFVRGQWGLLCQWSSKAETDETVCLVAVDP
jgi:hypothetical protein